MTSGYTTPIPGALTVTDTVVLKFHGIGKPHAQVPEDEQAYWLEPDLFVRWIESLIQLLENVLSPSY